MVSFQQCDLKLVWIESILNTVSYRSFLFCFVHNNLIVSETFSLVRNVLLGPNVSKWRIYPWMCCLLLGKKAITNLHSIL